MTKTIASTAFVAKSFRIAEADWSRLVALAKRERRKPSELIRLLIEERVNRAALRAA